MVKVFLLCILEESTYIFFTAQETSYLYVTLYLYGTGLWKEKNIIKGLVGWWLCPDIPV